MRRAWIPSKMREVSLWALWSLLIGGSTLWLLVGSVAYWVTRGWLPPDASGWFQALGALMAIGVAVAVPMWSRASDDARRKEDEFHDRKQRLDSVMSLVRHQIDLIQQLQSRPNRQHRMITDVAESLFELMLSQNDRELERMPVDAFGSRYISALLGVKGTAGMLVVIYRASPGDWVSYGHRLKRGRATMEALINRLVEEEEHLFVSFGKVYI